MSQIIISHSEANLTHQKTTSFIITL